MFLRVAPSPSSQPLPEVDFHSGVTASVPFRADGLEVEVCYTYRCAPTSTPACDSSVDKRCPACEGEWHGICKRGASGTGVSDDNEPPGRRLQW